MIGGDGRMEAALRFLIRRAEEGHRLLRSAEFAVWGIGRRIVRENRGEQGACWDRIVRCADPESAARGADVVILPLPVSRDGTGLFVSGEEGDGAGPELLPLIREIGPGTLLFGGRIPETARELARAGGLKVFDYFDDEAFQIRNAVPTAEGAVAACIDTLPVTVAGLRCTVFGYGRVGRTLAQRLLALGASVTAAARSPADRARAESDGCRAVPLEDWRRRPGDDPALFNTIPARILDGETVGRMRPGVVLFELAPGRDGSIGCDREAAAERGIRVISLPSLPGKCAPVTAGEIIGAAVLAELEAEAGPGAETKDGADRRAEGGRL